MPYIIRYTLLLFLLAPALGGCYPWWAKPYSLDLDDPPPGPPEYQQGYKDGCESGFKAYSAHYNKVWWEFKQDPKLRNNITYYKVWKDAYAYCAAFANSAYGHGLWNYNISGGTPGILPGASFQ